MAEKSVWVFCLFVADLCKLNNYIVYIITTATALKSFSFVPITLLLLVIKCDGLLMVVCLLCLF